jgi:hypothetical protein
VLLLGHLHVRHWKAIAVNQCTLRSGKWIPAKDLYKQIRIDKEGYMYCSKLETEEYN